MSRRSVRRRRRSARRGIGAALAAACTLCLALAFALANAKPETGDVPGMGQATRSAASGTSTAPKGSQGAMARAGKLPRFAGQPRGADERRNTAEGELNGGGPGARSNAYAWATRGGAGLGTQRRGSTGSLAGSFGSFGGGIGAGGFASSGGSAPAQRSVFSDLEAVEEALEPAEADSPLEPAVIAAASSNYDPCASGGLVVSPCFRPVVDPCPPGGLVVSPCVHFELDFGDDGEPGAAITRTFGVSFRGGQSPRRFSTPRGGEPEGDDTPDEETDVPDDEPDDEPDPDDSPEDVHSVPAPASSLLLALGLGLIVSRHRAGPLHRDPSPSADQRSETPREAPEAA